MGYVGVKKLTIKRLTQPNDIEIDVWENEKTGKKQITFSECAWAGEGITKKSEVKKVIKFLEDFLKEM